MYLEATKRTPHSPGEYKRYELTPAETTLWEQSSAQRSLIQECAELGNARARWLHGSYLEGSGDLLVFISKDKATLQNDPEQTKPMRRPTNSTAWPQTKGYALAMMAPAHNYAVGEGIRRGQALGNRVVQRGSQPRHRRERGYWRSFASKG
jgi:hypothetical protein